MKIRLPLSLRSALLACMTVFSPLATTISTANALALGAICYSMAAPTHAEDAVVSSYDDIELLANASDEDTIIMNMTGHLDATGDSNDHMGASFVSNAGTIQVDSWVINNGNSNTNFLFNGSITGEGDIVDGWNRSGPVVYNFAGDMSQFSGDIHAGDAIILNFGGHDDLTTKLTESTLLAEAQSVATSGDGGLGSASGTGAITSTGTCDITYNFTEKASILNSSITATGSASLNLTGGASYELKTDVSLAGQLNITDASSVNFSADALGNHQLSVGSLAMGDGTSLNIEAGQKATIAGATSLGSGASLSNSGELRLNGAVSLTGSGQVSIANSGSLILGENASITVGEDQSLELSGAISITSAGQIINNGSLSLAADVSFDLSQILLDAWTYNAEEQNYELQLIGGSQGFDWSQVDDSIITGYDSTLMQNVSLGSDGTLSFTYADGTAFFDGGSLDWSDGCSGFSSADGSDLVFNSGAHLVLTGGDSLLNLSGDVAAASLNLASGSTLSLSGAYQLDCANIKLASGSSLTFLDDVLSSDSLISSSSSSSASIIFAASDASAVFNYGTQLQYFTGNLSVKSGIVNLESALGYDFASLNVSGGSLSILADLKVGDASFSGGLVEFEGSVNSTGSFTITGDSASLYFGADSSLGKLLVSDSSGIANASISVGAGATLTVGGGANSSGADSYFRGNSGTKAGYTINLGEGALLSDNVKLWMGYNAINIQGAGRYEVTGLLIGYTGLSTTVALNVGAGATMEVVGEYEANNYNNSFVIGGASKVSAELNIEGTFIINSKIVRAAGASSIINVKEGGTFVLNKGFKAYNASDDASLLKIDVASGGRLEVGNQIDEVDYSSAMTVEMASGSTLASNGVDDETTIHHSINFADGGTHTLQVDAGQSLIMAQAINNNGTVQLTGGGDFTLAGSNDIQTLMVKDKSSLSLSSGVALFSQGGSLSLGSGSSLNMVSGGGIIAGNLSLAQDSCLIYTMGEAGASIGSGYSLTLDSQSGFIVGFSEKSVGSFTQILFTDLSKEQLEGFGFTDDFYNGMSGCLASDILSSDDSWNLEDGSVVYIDEKGNLILENLAKLAEWNGTSNGVWNSVNQNWLVEGEEDAYGNNREVYFGDDEDLEKNVLVQGTVYVSKMDVADDYSFDGGNIVVSYALNIEDGAQVSSSSNILFNEAELNIGEGSSLSMNGGSLNFSLDPSAFFDSEADALIQVGEGGSLKLSGTTLVFGPSESESKGMDISKFDGTILVLVDGDKAEFDGVDVQFSGGLVDKYFSNASIENGVVIGQLNYASYNDAASTSNGLAGLNLMSKALIAINPQADKDDSSDLGRVLDSLDDYKAAGQFGAADRLGAAVAGASTAALGSALLGDVQRQLGSMRNRSLRMGVDPTIVNDHLPHFNAWIAADGGRSSVDADGTMAGYSLSSIGGSVGGEIDFSDHLSVGLAFSALRGTLSVDGPDSAEGDLDSLYGSLYARVHHKRWAHSFVATFGSSDASLTRSISTSQGNISSKGDTKGSSFGLMYELGYTYALNEEASTCMQPIFNISYTKSQISGYSEKGSDIALTVGDQELSTLSIAAGVLVESIVGENLYNRSAVLGARAMLKFDAGDRGSEADVTLSSNSGVTETIKGAEYGALGLELGIGITVPVTEETGAVFADISCEYRSGKSSMSASVGYRFSF